VLVATDLTVDVITTLVDFTVEVVTDFCVVVGRCVVDVELSASLSFDLKKPLIPLKNPFFFVVASGAEVVVVVVVVRTTGGKGLKSASE
jgi:hypothetical protein